jgi:methylated-DNA-[protein]-cysteine S-methyltransferase
LTKAPPKEKDELFYTLWHTRAGWLGLLSSSKGLLGCSLPQRSKASALQVLGPQAGKANLNSGHIENVMEQLRRYFQGQKLQFSCPLDLRAASPFERAVWTTARSIPYGDTRSYAWIARQIGKPWGARAVGQALGRNPLPIIVPCHRVLKSDGGLGGFSGGLEMKQYLLNLERSNS